MNLTLAELLAIVQNAIEKYGEKKNVRLFNRAGHDIEDSQLVDYHTDKGNWVEFDK